MKSLAEAYCQARIAHQLEKRSYKRNDWVGDHATPVDTRKLGRQTSMELAKGAKGEPPWRRLKQSIVDIMEWPWRDRLRASRQKIRGYLGLMSSNVRQSVSASPMRAIPKVAKSGMEKRKVPMECCFQGSRLARNIPSLTSETPPHKVALA